MDNELEEKQKTLVKELQFLRIANGLSPIRIRLCPNVMQALNCSDAVEAVAALVRLLDTLGDDIKVRALKNALNIDAQQYGYVLGGVVARRDAFRSSIRKMPYSQKQVENWENDAIKALAGALLSASDPDVVKLEPGEYSLLLRMAVQDDGTRSVMVNIGFHDENGIIAHDAGIVSNQRSNSLAFNLNVIGMEFLDSVFLLNARRIQLLVRFDKPQQRVFRVSAQTMVDALLGLGTQEEMELLPADIAKSPTYAGLITGPSWDASYVLVGWEPMP